MKNLGKAKASVGGVMSARRAGKKTARSGAHATLGGSWRLRAVIVCVGSRGRPFASRKGGPTGACAYVGVNTAAHATLSLCPLSHAQAPAREFTCTHSRTDTFEKVCAAVCARMYMYVCVCVGARTCSPTKRKYVPGFYGRSERRRAVLLLE